MASTKERAFAAFAEEGPDAHSAAEWAEKLDSKKAYIYQLRGDFREQAEADEADEPASTPEEPAEATEPSEDTSPSETPPSEPATDAEGNGEPSPTTREASAPTTPDEAASEPSPAAEAEGSNEPAEPATDGGEAIAVGHEGTQKLSPDGFEDESTSSIDAPAGVDLPDDANPDDFEPDASAPDPDPQPDPEPEPEQDTNGGLLNRIRGDGEQSTPAEVVEDAPTDAEADRRADVLQALDGASGPPATTEDTSADDAPSTNTMQNGLVMDEDLVANLFGLPFTQAASATGWDGWKLTDEEKEANAKLLVAYCDEQNIDLSTGGMLAMSLLSTIGGRAAGYKKWKNAEDDDEPKSDPKSSDPDPEPATDGGQSEQTSTSTDPQPTTDDDADEFDFNDSDSW